MVGEDFTNSSWLNEASSTATRLNKYLMPDLNSDADRIEIVGPTQGRLVFTAEQGGAAIMQRVLVEHSDYECKDDGVSLKENKFEEWHDEASHVTAAFMWKSERYWRSTDGSLTIRRTGRAAAGFLFIMMFGSTEDWSRFPAAPPP